jgi:hypothetical protein
MEWHTSKDIIEDTGSRSSSGCSRTYSSHRIVFIRFFRGCACRCSNHRTACTHFFFGCSRRCSTPLSLASWTVVVADAWSYRRINQYGGRLKNLIRFLSQIPNPWYCLHDLEIGSCTVSPSRYTYQRCYTYQYVIHPGWL